MVLSRDDVIYIRLFCKSFLEIEYSEGEQRYSQKCAADVHRDSHLRSSSGVVSTGNEAEGQNSIRET